jgi:tRNA G18 (ribose-2'-O)-methylase SpoU
MPVVIHVSDFSDARLRDFSQLTDVELRKVREPEEGLYIAESRKVIKRALEAGHQPRSVLCPPDWLESCVELLRAYESVPIFVVPADEVQALTGYHVHRGALASLHRPTIPSVETLLMGATTVVILEDIVDHTNVGAIFRSVAGLGADAILVTPSCADPLYRRAIRVSMGTVLQVPWTRTAGWLETRDVLHAHGFHIAALALGHTARDLRDFVATRPTKVALVFGTEGDGLSSAALAVADSVVTIPMSHGVDSLNVAAASAVALYALRSE